MARAKLVGGLLTQVVLRLLKVVRTRVARGLNDNIKYKIRIGE